MSKSSETPFPTNGYPTSRARTVRVIKDCGLNRSNILFDETDRSARAVLLEERQACCVTTDLEKLKVERR